MVTVAYTSDLHSEHDGFVFNTTGLSPAVDAVVLAGDVVGRPADFDAIYHAIRKVTLSPILLVLGNHEFYGQQLTAAVSQYRAYLNKFNEVHLLEQDAVTIDGVRFLGTTLWSNLAEGKQRYICEKQINDFRLISYDSQRAINSDDIIALFNAAVSWLQEQFADSSLPTVVISHMAPSFLSQHPLAHPFTSGYFCSNLEPLIEIWQPSLWIHGHLHEPCDYSIGATRVVSNPWGYPKQDPGRIRDFKIITV